MSKGEGKKIVIQFTEALTALTVPRVVPTIRATNKGSGSGTSTTVTIPAEAEIGNDILLFWQIDASPSEAIDSGWERLKRLEYSMGLGVYHKKFDGTLQYTLTHVNDGTNWIIAVLDNVDSITVSTGVTGSGSTPNPDSLSSELGGETLWIAVAGSDSDAITGFPSNFLDNRIAQNGDGGIAIATKMSENASEDPEAFYITSDTWGACTLAIESYKYKGLIVSGQEATYRGVPSGELLDIHEKTFSCTLIAIDEVNPKLLNLTFSDRVSFRNALGNLTITFNKDLMTIKGEGGFVESFESDFSPQDLVQHIAPKLAETVSMDIVLASVIFTLFEITSYLYNVYPQETVSMDVSFGSATFTINEVV